MPIPEGTEVDDLTALILHPDGSTFYVFFVSGRFIQVWDLETVTQKDALQGWEVDPGFGNASRYLGGLAFFKTGVPSYATISADGEQIYTLNPWIAVLTTGNTSQLFAIRDAQRAEVLRTLSVNSRDLGDIYPGWAYSPDEGMYAVITPDRIEVINFNTAEILTLLVTTADTHFSAISFAPSSTILAAATADGIIKIWDLSSLIENGAIRHVITLADPGSVIHDMAFSPDGRLLATAEADGTIKIWDIGLDGGMGMSLMGRGLVGEDGAPVSIELSPDGKLMAVADPNGMTAVYDLERGERVLQLGEDHLEPVEQIEYAPDGATIATCKYAGPFQIWDAATGDELLRLDDFTEGDCSFDYRSDGNAVFLGFFKNGSGWHQEIVLPELEPGTLIEMEPLRTYEWLAPHEGASASLAFDDRTSSLAVVTGDNELFIWDTTMPYEGASPATSRISPSSSRALLARETGGYSDALADPINTVMVVTGIDGSLTIIDPESGQTIDTISAHVGRITAAAFSPDGKQLASGGLDRSIRVWDMETGDQLWSLTGQASPITDLAFSPDGKRLYAAGADGVIRPYVLDVDELMALAQSRVTRALTDEECRQYLHVESCEVAIPGQDSQG
jgi:WD40 repeat protein